MPAPRPRFKPRHFKAPSLALIWLLISLYFISQGTQVALWSAFAGVATIIGILGLWILFTDTQDR